LPLGRGAIGRPSAAANIIRDPTAMSTEILLPKIGFSMNEGQVAEWLYGDGEEVTEGEPLYLLEADKSTNEVEAPATGKLRIVAIEGETYDVGTVLGYIE
jgi:pyruvate/2-oxoglutarate dehydrogenase complex dihydrolipoamide acyltransferase (E2) component